MIVLFPLVLVGAAVLLVQRRAHADGRGWRWFGAWSAAGALFTFSFLTGFSIGLFMLPFAAALLLYVAWHAPHPAEAVGFVAGIGAMLLLVAFLSRDYTPCPEDGVLPGYTPSGEYVSACGGFDPVPWFLVGLAAFGAAVIAYAGASIHRRQTPCD